MSGDQLNLDEIEARRQAATTSHADAADRQDFLRTDAVALVAEVRRLRALTVVDDDTHPAFQPPSDHAGYFVESS